MAGVINKTMSQIYGDLFYIDNSNSGFDGTLRLIKDGTGGNSPMYISEEKFKVRPPSTDSTTAFQVTDTDNNALLTVDTTNNIVTVNEGAHIANTQYHTFGMYDVSPIAGIHYALVSMPVPNTYGADDWNSGVNGTTWGSSGVNPVGSLTLASVAEQFVPSVFLLQQNITIDEIQYLASADGATTMNIHLMQYDLVTGAGSSAGDLSNGVVIAQTGSASDSLSPVHVGDDRMSNGTLTINTADINDAKVLIVFAENVGGTDDITVQVNLKYHLR